MLEAIQTVPRCDAIYSSDLTRCRILAERLAGRDGVRPVYDERLREYDFGAWEGQQWSDIPRAQSDVWAADYWNNAPPGGECFADLHGRVATALREVPPGALIVCHAGVIRAAQIIQTGATPADVFAQPVPHCQPISFLGTTV